MAVLERLDADGLRRTLFAYRDALAFHRDAINRLNVYPVPDGDTGTNMALTLASVCAELGEGADMTATCSSMSRGSLMGARGNSGVILSQVLRGFSEVVREHETADGGVLATALAAGAKGAYAAVMRPAEGTMLTVAREAAEAAEARASEGGALIDVAEAAHRGAAESLRRTPELLPVLREAGVVDAGGAGLVLLLDALLHVLAERPLPEPDPVPEHLVVPAHDGAGQEGPPDISGLRYEVMYFLEAKDEAIPAFKDVWAGIGDSIVVVGGDGLWNCHIHTDDIGAAIEAALDCGRPRQIRVTDLLEQVEEERWVRDGVPMADHEPEHLNRPVSTAVVAVATGDGVRRIFHSLGVQRVVSGGQTMNPSTAQLLEAVESAPADEVVILPNNKNIIPVAEHVDGETAKTVRVVPTRGIAEGIAALIPYDPHAGVDENLEAMTDAAGDVVTGEVTRAVRDAPSDLGPIHAGDYLGLSREGIRAVDPTVAGACTGLLDQLVTSDHELVTIIEGQGATPADTRRITEWLAEHHPDVTAEVHHGGQPLYPYVVGLE